MEEYRHTKLSVDQGFNEKTGYSAAYDGNNILLGTRDDNTVLFIDAGVSTSDNSAVAGCDYSDADIYNGWGCNATTGESCPSLNSVSDQMPTAQCVDSDGDGFGWNGVETCTPETSATDDVCDYSKAALHGGWGWNEADAQSCAPLDDITTQQQVTQCIDSDGDGYGWNGSATCDPSI